MCDGVLERKGLSLLRAQASVLEQLIRCRETKLWFQSTTTTTPKTIKLYKSPKTNLS